MGKQQRWREGLLPAMSTSCLPCLASSCVWYGRDLRSPRLDVERMCLAGGCDPFGNEVILQLPRKKIPTDLTVWQASLSLHPCQLFAGL